MKISDKLSIRDLDVKGKRVVMRVDFNVPLENGKVKDRTRVVATIPTIKLVQEKGAHCIVLLSHCGRPDGRVKPEFSLKPVVPVLEELLGREVTFVSDCVGPEAEKAAAEAPEGAVLLMENVRFHIEEEGKGVDESGKKVSADKEKTEEFRASLSRLGNVFINDAFGTAHRAHSSMVGVKHEQRAAGLLMEKELQYFGQVLENPPRPFLAILGGAKVVDKIKLIENLLDKVDMMIIGGGMAYTFLKTIHGMEIGNSLYDAAGAEIVPKIMEKGKAKGVEMLFPCDFTASTSISSDADTVKCTLEEGIKAPYGGVDCGPKSVEKAREMILKAKLICWNGPQGVFETPAFATGSLGFLDAVVEATKNGTVSVVGGGDTASLVENAGKAKEISHVSTGGGASLELLEGKELPGVMYLSDKKN